MQRVTLYSRSGRARAPEAADAAAGLDGDTPTPEQPAAATSAPRLRTRIRNFFRRHQRPAWLAGGAVLALLLVLAHAAMNPAARPITQDDIDLAVEPGQESETVKGVGSGVVIVDKGIILTNLHVVAGASRVGVEFFDGTQSEAIVIATQPENDLAVL